ncbi:carboxylesterase, type B [Pseudomassariella vexata]|uniref:Carboxylesterase, type B n=1 Tax=Pseudomassariella vexata TaxID=1141098 RepID=A0A1Y2EBY0_9PEZI|nr:carboxylesterase, type B [Pseudomassariella vexata]ORY69089.1 carboxylesterase, type B [Pseudomassariella vexata]
MMQVSALLPLALAISALGQTFPPYYQNLTQEPARTLSSFTNLTVETRTGTFVGFLNDTYPDVRQFLRIPFAQPPVGELRWLPPQKLPNSSRKYDSTKFGPACPQYVSGKTSMYNQYQPPNLLVNLGENLNQGSVAWASAEDCLTLAVWTPSFANKTSKLPVALFVTGGGGVTGAIDIPSQLPPQWISRSQEHIVVTMNYRSNIFGNPKSRALNETSLTLLDVRAAVEWVSENIGAFGGDAENILLWGQSQGAGLTHAYTLAFPDDPLASSFGMISTPPSVVINLTTTPDPYADFDIVAKALGCNYFDDWEAELECMRQVSWVQISEFINRYNSTPSIAFTSYIPDERYIFSNETQRYIDGKIAKGPAIRSHAARESPSTNETAVEASQLRWDCATASDVALRHSIGLDTHRYLWAGNFSNISPVPWLGAFHWSDLFMIFGTYRLDVGEVTQLEVDTSATMQGFLLAFLKDPSTVQSTAGWPVFDPEASDGGTIVEFGLGQPARNITGYSVDGACYN